MTILVLGTITRDTEVFLDRQPIESLGGILHNVMALSSLTQDTIIPIANVGADVFDDVISRLKPYPNIAIEGLRKVPAPNNHCFLFFVLEYPAEVLVGRVPRIDFNQVKPFISNAQSIMINFTSGFDLTLNTLRSISNAAMCPVFLGYQLLGLGVDSLGNRYLRRRHDWLDWTGLADFVQFDRFEAEHAFRHKISSIDEACRFAWPILKRRSKAVTVTLGAEGAFIIFKNNKKIESVHIPAFPVTDVIDASGCGDVYSAAFMSFYLRFGSITSASRFASFVASKKCGIPGLANLERNIPAIRFPDQWSMLAGIDQVNMI